MPTLLLLNGPPGIGKSTLARRYVAERPLAFCLDLDLFRRLVGQWDRYPQESGLLTRRMAIAMARVPLAEGHDVVVPQYLGRLAFIQELARLAANARATFTEVLLTDAKDSAVARFYARRQDAEAAVHQREAESQVGGEEGLAELYDRLHSVTSQRPLTKVITSRAGDVDATYRDLLAVVDDT